MTDFTVARMRGRGRAWKSRARPGLARRVAQLALRRRHYLVIKTICLAAILLTCLSFASNAAAQNGLRSRVTIVGARAATAVTAAEAELRTRLHAELRANGFDPVDARSNPAALDSVAAALEDSDAVAAFALVSVQDGVAVDVWLSDAMTGKTLVRRVTGEHGDDATADPSLLAVRAVELLRASLLEIAVREPPEPHLPPPQGPQGAGLPACDTPGCDGLLVGSPRGATPGATRGATPDATPGATRGATPGAKRAPDAVALSIRAGVFRSPARLLRFDWLDEAEPGSG